MRSGDKGGSVLVSVVAGGSRFEHGLLPLSPPSPPPQKLRSEDGGGCFVEAGGGSFTPGPPPPSPPPPPPPPPPPEPPLHYKSPLASLSSELLWTRSHAATTVSVCQSAALNEFEFA